MNPSRLLRSLLLAVVMSFVSFCALAQSAGETFRVQSVNTLGCNSGNFGMTVVRSNLDGGADYTVHTVATVDNLIYMNEAASISINGTTGWNLFNNFTYGAVANPGTWPIPAGRPLRIDFSLERPQGNAFYFWTLIVDGCDTGNIIFNGPTASFSAPIPTVSEWGLMIMIALLGLFAAWEVRRRNRTC